MTATSGAKNDGEQEQHAGDDRGETGAGALADAGGRLDVGGVATRRRPRHRRRRRASRRPGCARCSAGMPSSSSRPASAPIAVIVPMVSKKSASISVKTSRIAVTTPTRSKEPNRLKWPSSAEVGGVDDLVGQRRHVEAPAGRVDASPPTPGRRRRSPRRSIASTVVTMIEIRMAPVHLADPAARSRAAGRTTKTSDRPARRGCRRRRAGPARWCRRRRGCGARSRRRRSRSAR